MSEAQASIEKLFAEPFEPVWMKRQREAALQAEQEQSQMREAKKNSWRQLLIDSVNPGWKLEAEKSHNRIMAKCKGVWYHDS